MAKYVVAPVSDFPSGSRRIVDIQGRSIGVFNLDGEYVALRSSCPHQGAPLCLGQVRSLVVSSRPFEVSVDETQAVIKCPWHGWEFNLRTGQSVFNPHRVRVRRYEVTVEPADPSVETFTVTVEDELVVVHV